jgi:hypothetical protein
VRTAAAGVVVFVLALATIHGQTTAFKKTPWGDPDLQGTWTNQTLTPLERPAELAGKPVLTEAEAGPYETKLRREANVDAREPGTRQDVALGYNDVWWDRGNRIVADRRTSLVSDPADGRIPALTPEGQARGAADRRAAAVQEESAASWEEFDASSRCIMRSPLPKLASAYNNNFEIVQSPGYVAIMQEQVHDVRIIPLNGMPHLPGTVRQWLGDSRGRFEGDTLVVETTNFTGGVRGATFRESTPNMVLVERFRRTSEGTIDYRFTITDPDTWTRPWTVVLPWNKEPGLIYEYACHEGNYSMQHMLEAIRAAEAAVAKGK